ncbi:MAG: GntP family permease [Cyclobacteriaceae bacterium]
MITAFLILLLAVCWIIVSISVWKWHPFLSLIVAALGAGLALGLPLPEVVSKIGEGFGGLLASIGVIIVLGSILGMMMEQSGAAQTIASVLMNGIGRKHPMVALSFLGAFVGIPVFCDAGFIILSRLIKQISERTGQTPACLSVGLAAGLYATHTLVPPTPGPIAAAGNLGATSYLGLVILTGFFVAFVTLPMALWLGTRLTRNVISELPEAPASEGSNVVSLAPWRALVPIVLPILLISLGTISNLASWDLTVIDFAGNPMIALLISVFVGFFCLKLQSVKVFTQLTTTAISQAGPILIITGAGGAFGAVLKASSLTSHLTGLIGGGHQSGMVILLAAFGVAAILKTAQGSSTAAIVVTSSLLAPMIGMSGVSPMFVTLCVIAIGGGAMTFSHANDSYFWVVSQFSGLKVGDAYRSYSIVSAVQGLSVLVVVLILNMIVG